LWTLYHRSIEARRPDVILTDPQAVALVDAIDYPFAERADPSSWRTAVALGEGLETQFWRVNNGRVRWVTVDVPETVAVRERLRLPRGRGIFFGFVAPLLRLGLGEVLRVRL
jgi:O-methyltransferase involved in polyketide biosynthesis